MPDWNPTYEGTALAPTHVGDTAAKALSLPHVVWDAPGAEADNAVPLTGALHDSSGRRLKKKARLLLRVHTADLVPAAATALTLSEGAKGTVVSTDAKAALLLDTDDNGEFAVSLADVSAALAAKVWVSADVVDEEGAGGQAWVGVTFA